jgi:putative two-component system response regulator
VSSIGPILCVDDDAQVRTFIARVLDSAGHECVAAADATEARALLAETAFSAILCDINLPGESGLELLRDLRADHPEVAAVMVTGRDEPALADTARDLGALGYLTKPFEPNALLIDLANALHRRDSEVKRRSERDDAVREAYLETLRRLSRAVEFHDGATGAHVERVAAHAASIARRLGLEPDRVDLVRVAAPLHDIGKIGVPTVLLRKPGPLNDVERIVMQHHTDLGRDLLAGSGNDLLELAATIAWTHHERWDGSGYPRGLAGAAIPLEGRIVALADAFDAMTNDRPYRAARSVARAISLIEEERGAAFDPDIVDAFTGGLV